MLTLLTGSQVTRDGSARASRATLTSLVADSQHESSADCSPYGKPEAIVLARFVPVVRTVLNPVAGALEVPVGTFTLWQVVGGLVWSVGLTLAGYALGSSIPNVDRYLLPMVALIVVVSLVPLVAEVTAGTGPPGPRRAAGDQRPGQWPGRQWVHCTGRRRR